MSFSKSQLYSLSMDWSRVANNPIVKGAPNDAEPQVIEVEECKGVLYAYGSELAMLRLKAHYGPNFKARASYSKNMKTFYFSLETDL